MILYWLTSEPDATPIQGFLSPEMRLLTLLCFALHYFASSCSALVFLTLLCFTLLRFALLYFALLCFALISLLFFAVLCFTFLYPDASFCRLRTGGSGGRDS